MNANKILDSCMYWTEVFVRISFSDEQISLESQKLLAKGAGTTLLDVIKNYAEMYNISDEELDLRYETIVAKLNAVMEAKHEQSNV